MPLKKNWTSGTLPAAAARVNCGITCEVSISVADTETPFWALNLVMVSVIHFWIPTAPCWPHHHILMLLAEAVAGRPKACAPCRYGARPAATVAPPATFSSLRRDSGRVVSTSSSSCWGGPCAVRVDDARDLPAAQEVDDLRGGIPREVPQRRRRVPGGVGRGDHVVELPQRARRGERLPFVHVQSGAS